MINNQQNLKKSTKLLMLILDDYFHYIKIIEETKNTWKNYRKEVWENLLIEHEYPRTLPTLSKALKLQQKIKGYRTQNSRLYHPIFENRGQISKILRDTEFHRAKKHKELEEILKSADRRRVSLLHSRIKKVVKSRKIA